MKVQVFNNNRMGTTLVAEGIPGYIPFGYPPEVVAKSIDDLKLALPVLGTSDASIYAPVGDAVAEFEV